MRNIIFRGKRIYRNGEWGYGDLRRFGGNTWVFPHDKDAAYDADMVDPETVGEFTGLMDMNGKGIFEGDIIEYDYAQWVTPKRNKGRVFYDGGSFIVTVGIGAVVSMPIGFLYGDGMRNTVAVVGNIYDNPELLKQE